MPVGGEEFLDENVEIRLVHKVYFQERQTADQRMILDLLGADAIGLVMGDEDQLWPEDSTSALISHHPYSKYFAV